MAPTQSEPPANTPSAEVFTLPELASYLRVPEEAVLELVSGGTLPGRRIGGEWRFLKPAVVEWLRLGPNDRPGAAPVPPKIDPTFWADLLQFLERRLLDQSSPIDRLSAPPGSKQAVLRHFGVFTEDGDLEQQLATLHAERKADEE